MKPKIRVALSGSGTKAPAHVGALAAIEAAGYEIVELAGTSGGALCAGLYACGLKAAALRALVMEMDWAPLMAVSPWSILAGKGYCSGDALLKFMTSQTGGKTFADLEIDLTIMASDVSSEVPYRFDRQLTPAIPVALAGRASASIPIVFAPVLIGSAVLMDGGLVVNLPVDLLMIDDTPRIGVELTSQCEPFKPGHHGLNKIVPHLIDLMHSVLVLHIPSSNFIIIPL
ncbi:MAG: patatin-like phospholipase family protein [Nevskia sp.]|nr:patatin-like phospholipase family protein [Nevskia sp.]